MPLDPRTLLFAETVTSLVGAVGFLLLSRAAVIPGARRWIVANLLAATALALTAAFGIAAEPTITMSITGLLVFVSFVYQTEAILIFSELRYRRALARAFEFLGVLVFAATYPLHRLDVFAAILAIGIGIPAAIVTWRVLVRRRRALRVADGFLAVGYGLIVVAAVLAVITVPGGAANGAPDDGPAQSAFYGLGFLAIVLTQAGYVVMTKQESDFRLQRLATTDALTELWNRRTFLEAAETECARGSRTQAALAIIMFDVDHFKRINDAHGHAAGDVVLRAFARSLRGAVRPYDRVCRYGGEEFAVLLRHTEMGDAHAIAERILADARATALELGGTLVRYTASAGVAVGYGIPAVDELLAAADAALYRAKRAGRDRAERATAADAVASIPA